MSDIIVCAFISCTLREKSIENGDRSRKVWGAHVVELGDFLMMLTSVLSCVYPPPRDDTYERGEVGVSVPGVQLRLYPVSCTYILKQGGRLYRRGNNATGVPERFHYTASRGIISRDISPRSTPRGWNSVPPTRLAWEMNLLCEVEHHPEQPPFGGRARLWRAREEIASNRPHHGARDRHAATENGRWPGCDRKYEGAVLIMQRDFTLFGSCIPFLKLKKERCERVLYFCYGSVLLSFWMWNFSS